MPNRKIVWKFIFFLFISGLVATLHQNAAQYSPKRLLALVGFAAPGEVDRSLLLFDPQNRSLVTIITPLEIVIGSPPRWSPNGQYIAYTKIDEKTHHADIFIYNVQSQEEIKITDDDKKELCMNWTHDGQAILYSSESSEKDISTYKLNISTLERIEIARGLNIRCISLSPNGETYVFSRDTPLDGQAKDSENIPANIFVSDIEFSEITQLTDTGTFKYDPIWSNDGRYIAFGDDVIVETFELLTELIVMDMESLRTKKIASSTRSSFISFNWLNDRNLTYTNSEINHANQVRRVYITDVVSGQQSFIDLPDYTQMLVFDWSPPLDTILPTPTPTIPGPNLNLPLAPDCPNALPSRLGMFMVAGVPYAAEGEVRTTLRVRETPGGAQVGSLNPGQRFRIMEQAVCGEDGLRWWPIEALDGSLAGWSAESLNDTYLMEPIATQ